MLEIRNLRGRGSTEAFQFILNSYTALVFKFKTNDLQPLYSFFTQNNFQKVLAAMKIFISHHYSYLHSISNE